jgi:hypothetical protein
MSLENKIKNIIENRDNKSALSEGRKSIHPVLPKVSVEYLGFPDDNDLETMTQKYGHMTDLTIGDNLRRFWNIQNNDITTYGFYLCWEIKSVDDPELGRLWYWVSIHMPPMSTKRPSFHSKGNEQIWMSGGGILDPKSEKSLADWTNILSHPNIQGVIEEPAGGTVDNQLSKDVFFQKEIEKVRLYVANTTSLDRFTKELKEGCRKILGKSLPMLLRNSDVDSVEEVVNMIAPEDIEYIFDIMSVWLTNLGGSNVRPSSDSDEDADFADDDSNDKGPTDAELDAEENLEDEELDDDDDEDDIKDVPNVIPKVSKKPMAETKYISEGPDDNDDDDDDDDDVVRIDDDPPEEDDEPEFDPQAGDIAYSDSDRGPNIVFYKYGKVWLEVDRDEAWDTIYLMIRNKMKEDNHYTNLWHESDHGNLVLDTDLYKTSLDEPYKNEKTFREYVDDYDLNESKHSDLSEDDDEDYEEKSSREEAHRSWKAARAAKQSMREDPDVDKYSEFNKHMNRYDVNESTHYEAHECPPDGTDSRGCCLGGCSECDEHLLSTGRYTTYCPSCDTCPSCGCPNTDGFQHYEGCQESMSNETLDQESSIDLIDSEDGSEDILEDPNEIPVVKETHMGEDYEGNPEEMVTLQCPICGETDEVSLARFENEGPGDRRRCTNEECEDAVMELVDDEVSVVKESLDSSRFVQNDILIMHSPHTDEDVEVNYRGPISGTDKAVVVSAGSQFVVPMSWLSKKPEQGLQKESIESRAIDLYDELHSTNKSTVINPNTFKVLEEGLEPCTKCGGYGFIVCDTCESTGKVWDVNNSPSDCPDCKGFGRTKCETCDGSCHTGEIDTGMENEDMIKDFATQEPVKDKIYKLEKPYTVPVVSDKKTKKFEGATLMETKKFESPLAYLESPSYNNLRYKIGGIALKEMGLKNKDVDNLTKTKSDKLYRLLIKYMKEAFEKKFPKQWSEIKDEVEDDMGQMVSHWNG